MASPSLFRDFWLLLNVDREAAQRITTLQGCLHDIQLVQPEEEPGLRAELGIPNDVLIIRIKITNPLGWEGYVFELVGTQASCTPGADTIFDFIASHHPQSLALIFCLKLYNPNTKMVDDILLAAWRRRIYCEGIPLYLEARWHPTTGGAITLKGLEKDARKKSMDRARKGIKLLKAIEAVGRPVGSTVIPEALFRQRYPEVYRECEETYTTPPKRYEIADALGISVDTFERYLTDYGLTFPPF